MRSSSIFAMTAAVGLCLSAAVASASPNTPIDSNLLATTGTSAFGNAVTAGTSFADIFTFTMPSAATTGGTSVISVQGNSINFTDLSVWQNGTEVATSGATSGSPILGNAFINIFNFGASLTGWSIHVAGNALAGAQSYGGSISVSPVPEPKTYAMLLAGLGLLAFTARRRKTSFF